MIKTKRLIIKPFEMKYLHDYHEGFDDKVTRYQWPDPFKDITAAEETLQSFISEMENGETLFLSVLSEDEAFIGSVEVHGLDTDCPELGIWITASQQNKGYAYEALSAVIEYVRSAYGKHDFFYEADIRNTSSNKLLNKLRNNYLIEDLEVEELTTESDKQLILQGHTINQK